MRRGAALFLAAISLHAAAVDATTPTIPPLSRQSLVGRWEGISEAEPRLFVLSIEPEKGTSLLSVVVTADGTRMVFNIDRIEVKDGRLAFRGEGLGEAKTYTVKVVGSGTGFRGYGRMNVKITVAEESRHEVHSWKVTAVMMSGGYVNWLKQLYDAGERSLIEEQKRLTRR